MISLQTHKKSKHLIRIMEILVFILLGINLYHTVQENNDPEYEALQILQTLGFLRTVILLHTINLYLDHLISNRIGEGIQQENYTPITLIIALINMDNNQPINWLTFVIIVLNQIYVAGQYWLTNWFYILNIVACIMFGICQILCRIQYEPFPQFKINNKSYICNQAKIFIVFFILLVIGRIIFYIYYSTYDTMNYFTIIVVLVQTGLFITIFYTAYCEIKKIDPTHISNENKICFNDGICLIKAITNQQKYQCQQSLLLMIICIQSIVITFAEEDENTQNLRHEEKEQQQSIIIDHNLHKYVFYESIILICYILDKIIIYICQKLFAYFSIQCFQILIYTTQDHPYISINTLGQYNREICQEEILQNLQQHDNKDCPICLQLLEIDLVNLTCHKFHIFHRECVEQWFQQHNFCPICRNVFQQYQIH